MLGSGGAIPTCVNDDWSEIRLVPTRSRRPRVKHHDRPGVNTPGGKSLPVECPLELGVEAFGVLAHPVQPRMR